jgi:tetratricopeptide (TPR) repeat protein
MNTRLDNAENYIETGRYEKAINFLNEFIKSENNIKAYQLRGIAYYNMQDFEAAIADLLHVVQNDSEAHVAHFYLSQIYMYTSDFARAKEHIEMAVSIDKENLDYLGDYITIEQSLKNYQHSIEICDRILNETPDSNFALIARGYANMHLGNTDSAIDDFESAVRESPYDFSGWNNLGIARLKKGEHEKAFQCFHTAIQNNPNNSDAYSYMGYLYHSRGDQNKAMQYINKSIELETMNPNAFKHRALVYLALQDRDKAKSDLLQAKQLGYAEYYDNEVDELLKDL